MRARYYKSMLLLLAGMMIMSCENRLATDDTAGPEIVLEGSISNATATKAVAAVADYVGRGLDVQGSSEKSFENGDKMVLTDIHRTSNPIARFTYSNMTYTNSDGSWSKQGDGRIYWSDAENPHTFIGYSLPGDDFYWDSTTKTGVYYGSLGDPSAAASTVISYASNDQIKTDDLLLTYSETVTAEPGGSVAKVVFRHALANVRVIVNIRGFAPSSDSEDTKSRVFGLKLNDMPVMYKWTQDSDAAKPLDDTDPHIYKGQTRTIETWIPNPSGVGANAEKTFTFYSLAVPGTTNLVMPFKVSYPEPLNPTSTVTKDYTARIDNVLLKAGHCTTISVSLNHADEDMTVGALYEDWEFKESPDEGSLRKNSVFLEKTDRSFVTIVGDDLATEDDAVWLYRVFDNDGQPAVNNGKPVILDIYGHSGDTAADAYQISSAQQLLSFAYEVNTAADASKNRPTMDFAGKYVKLDADITLQPSRSASTLTWIGIGSAGSPFKGTFLGSSRAVSRLKGKSLFGAVDTGASIERLALKDVINIGSSTGAITDSNSGTVLASYVDGMVSTTSAEASGSLVGTNSGTVLACYHTGGMSAAGNAAGIVGTNAGTVKACYNAGAITSGSSFSSYGVAAATSGSGTVVNSFYNSKIATNVVGIAPSGADQSSGGKVTNEMQKQAFVTELNSVLGASDPHFVYKAASYPSVE